MLKRQQGRRSVFMNDDQAKNEEEKERDGEGLFTPEHRVHHDRGAAAAGRESLNTSLSSAASAIKSTQLELSRLLNQAKSCGTPTSLGKNEAVSMDQYMDLQRRYSALEKQYHVDLASRERECELLQNKLDNITRAMSELRWRDEERERKLSQLKAMHDHDEERVKDLSHTVNTLRELLMENMNLAESEQLKLEEANSFFARLGECGKQILDQSEPPEPFPFYRVEPVHALELDKTKVRLKQTEQELVEVKTKLEAQMKANSKTKTQKQEHMRRMQTIATSKQTQLIGAMRRIQYLIEERDKAVKESNRKDKYIAKVESKLLELNTELLKTKRQFHQQKQKQHFEKTVDPSSSPPVSRRSKTNATRSTSEDEHPTRLPRSPPEPINTSVKWEFVYAQSTLDTPPSQKSKSIENSLDVSLVNSMKIADLNSTQNLAEESPNPAPVDAKWQEFMAAKQLENAKSPVKEDVRDAEFSYSSSSNKFQALLEQEIEAHSNPKPNDDNDLVPLNQDNGFAADIDQQQEEQDLEDWLQKIGVSI